MSAKAVLVFCAQALLVQSAFSQCTSRAAVDASGIGAYGWGGSSIAPTFAYDGLAAPYGYNGLATSYAYNGLAAPYAYDGFAAPWCYDGLAAPYAYDRLAGSACSGLGYEGLYPAIASAIEITPTTGGGLIVTSASPVPPTGISVISENAYDGILTVAGEAPFVGTTGMEGVLPTTGSGAINHACGNGINAMVSETTAFAPGYAAFTPAAAITPAVYAPGLAITPSWAPAGAYGYGCGCLY